MLGIPPCIRSSKFLQESNHRISLESMSYYMGLIAIDVCYNSMKIFVY
jgi:hypothetical protein